MPKNLLRLAALLLTIAGFVGWIRPLPSPAAPASGVIPASVEVRRRPPLILTTEGTEQPHKLGVSRVDVDVRIVGYLAETRMTMVFANPWQRPLGGDLYFPLPEGATVSGYALDVNGTMVDGVVVEKEKARRVLETEMRRGVDPGLAELALGNVFKTRVFPIPARGSRTVSVSWVGSVEGSGSPFSYRLPLMFQDKLGDFHVRVEVVKGQARPVVTSQGIPGLEFGAWRDSFVAEARVKDQALTQDLVVQLPDVEKAPLQVERAADGSTYFVINEMASDPRGEPAAPSPAGKVTILWDASGSRAKSNHEREMAFLRSFFAHHQDADLEVGLVVFRVLPEPERRFTVKKGDASALLTALAQVPYDGATQMGRLPVQATASGSTCLLFTDGFTNFGQDVPSAMRAPLHILVGDTEANHPFLHFLAAKSGGTCSNLGRQGDAQILASMEAHPWTFLGATTQGGKVETWPRDARPVQGRFTLAGRLEGDETKVTLHYGAGGREITHTDYTVRTADATTGGLLRRFWAMQKVAELSALYERNEATIVALGKTYGLVTPGTSLIVLETLDQYVTHAIEPPASLPQMRKDYAVAIERRHKAERVQETAKIERVLKMWQARVAWWSTKFEYPPDLKMPDQQRQRREMEDGRADRVLEAQAPASPAGRVLATGSPASEMSRAPRPADARTAEKSSPAPDERSASPTIVIQPWNPDTPYLKALQAAPAERRLEVYLAQKRQYGKGPAFYLDCADLFARQHQDALSLQVLSNLAEMELENPALMRILAHRLEQLDQLDLAVDIFERARRMRMEEPQSHRDLALALAKRARKTGSVDDYRRSMQLLNHVVMNQWDRFDEIEVIALEELNAIWAEFGRRHPGLATRPPCDPRLVKLLDVDIRILLNWDADMTDMDLHVVEPSGERAYYGHNRTRIGGLVSRDFTQGYGPEEYMVRRAMHGKYQVLVNYFGSSAATLLGPVTVQAEVITDFGRPTEKRKSLTLRLTGSKETEKVGEITL